MLEFIDRSPDVDVLQSEYTRLLGYPVGHLLEGRAAELAERTREWYAKNGSPWYYARLISDLQTSDNAFSLGGATFHSKQLLGILSESESNAAFVVAAGAGDECVERSASLWAEGKPDEYFFMEAFGSAVVERLVTAIGGTLCEWAEPQGRMVLPHYSPGYPEWDISEQGALYRLICDGASQAIGDRLSVMDSGMLAPKKSILAVFGVTDQVAKALSANHLIPCENCTLAGCDYRRKPYFLDTMKNLGNEQRMLAPSGASRELAVLDTEANYSISPRALRKWAESRLVLRPAAGGGFEAVFTYDGTTCSNLGHPLRYLYRVSLGGPETRYTILDASCEAEKGDEGHTKQCEYVKNGDKLEAAIHSERPLVGEPLDAVLDWNHPSSAAGCFCEGSSRNHKWTIAYEVLHFALARREKEKAS